MPTAEDIIGKLNLVPLDPEGGFFTETYRSAVTVGSRALSTAIYYLLTANSFSRLHKLLGDEIYHFYGGDPVEMLQLRPEGTSKVIRLGADVLSGLQPQVTVPGGVWQGSRLGSTTIRHIVR